MLHRGDTVVPLASRWASMGTLTEVTVGLGPLSVEEVVAVARHGAPVALAEHALEEIDRSRAAIDGPDGQLERNLVRSHAAGTGPEVEREVVRAMMLLRLSALATGRSGVRPETASAYADMLSAGITPIVREHGSLGSAGDLVPLAHCALGLMGEGSVRDGEGRECLAAVALPEVGIAPVMLADKEGHALVEGADGTLGMLVLAIADLRMLLSTADVAAAMSVEGLLGSDDAFAAGRREPGPQRGQAASAANIRALLHGSPLVAARRAEGARDRDASSLRCAPVVAGGARDTLEHAARVAERELAAVGDPGATADGCVAPGDGAHGAPLAYVLDFLAIVAADLASISERRTDRFLDGARSRGLPPFLAGDPLVHSGYMAAQHTQAALVAELKRLAAPASVDSIPGSAMREDHVSMGWAAARKLRRAVDALAGVLGIELLTAARGVRIREPLEPAAATAAVIAALEERVRAVRPDHCLAPDIDAAVELVRSGRARAAAEGVAGPLA